MKAGCILLAFVALAAFVTAEEINSVEPESKAQAAEIPQMPTIDGKLQPSKTQKRGLYGYGWGWGPGWGYGGYGWGGHPGFYGGWGGPYGYGYGYGYGWGGYFY